MSDAANPDSPFYERKYYAGAKAQYSLESVDNASNPGQGIMFHTGVSYMKNLDEEEEMDVTKIYTDVSFYLTLLARPKLVVATKLEYQKIFGEPQLYQYPSLGNDNGLRPYRNQRFRGTSSFVQMTDLRMHLFNWNNTILPMSVGIMAGHDYGRVWLEDEEAEGYLSGFTFGISMNILDLAVLHPYYSIADDSEQFTLRLGFSF